jgi:glycosyltransferase involved in cell wall biosynthesis/SAM-dependent methyltransferase
MDRKDKVFSRIDKRGAGLEIGPSHNPIAPKREGYNVEIIDVLDRDHLIARYKDEQVNLENIEEVDFVWSGEKFQELIGKPKHYDYIIASHVIEHSPNLIGFLNDCDAVLKDDGVISLVVPDKRYHFDHFRPISGISKIIDSHFNNCIIHTPGTVAEYYLNAVSQSGNIAWGRESTGNYGFMKSLRDAGKAMQEVTRNSAYVDAHAWCFVPSSFRLIIHDLFNLGLIPFQEVCFYPTDGCEFYITLGRRGQGIDKSRMEMLEFVESEISQAAEDKLHEVETRLREVEVQLPRISEAENRAVRVEEELARVRNELIAVYDSRSWRVTSLLRVFGRQTRKASMSLHALKDAVARRGGLAGVVPRALRVFRAEGWAGVRKRLATRDGGNQVASPYEHTYREWVERFGTLTESGKRKIHMRIAAMPRRPRISVLMPTYNTNLKWLAAAIDSVRQQLYPDWELCIADDASTDIQVREFLQSCANKDSRIKVCYRESNGHISAASNSALALAGGEWVALLDHDDILAADALFWVVETINANPDARMVYSDEDKVDENGVRFDPFFKCDWNYTLFLSQNMFSHLGVYHAALARQVGGFREGFEGSQDYDLALRCMEHVAPAQIQHIPRILYHWRAHASSTAQSVDAKPYAMQAGERALNDYLGRAGKNARAELIGFGYRIHYNLPEPLPLVSLIVPTRNGLQLIKTCISSIRDKTSYTNYEILLVDNASDDAEVLNYLSALRSDPKIRVLRDARPFNFSALNNHAIREARGEVVGLLNNDIEVISPDWLSEMVSYAVQPDVGAVGARLWYPNETLQHGGIILGVGGIAAHSHWELPRHHNGYFCRATLASEYSAVTGACLFTRKELFENLGGLNEVDLPVAFNDVDYCLRARERGYRIVWTPFADLYHHESATRGPEDTPEKRARFSREIAYMTEHWREILEGDPMYSPNLSAARGDFSFAWPPRLEFPG